MKRYRTIFSSFIENINYILGSDIETTQVLLPLAISFFTFQQIAFIVDSYKNKTTKFSIHEYILFITFFPQLIAGPIVKYNHMMTQFENASNRIINRKNLNLGLVIILIGLFKKDSGIASLINKRYSFNISVIRDYIEYTSHDNRYSSPNKGS